MTRGSLATWAGDPLAMRRPASSTTTRSLSVMITSMTCSTTSSAIARSRSARSTSSASCVSVGVSPDSASSRTIRRGPVASARQLDALLQRDGQLAGERRADGGQPRHPERLDRAVPRGPASDLAQERADDDVVDHAHLAENLYQLERPGNPGASDLLGRAIGQVPPVEQHAARIDAHLSGQPVEEGRLARAVRSDEADDLRRSHGDVDPIVGQEPAEPLGQSLDLEQRLRGHGSPAQRCTGSETRKVAPLPAAPLSTEIVPPCASTFWRAM